MPYTTDELMEKYKELEKKLTLEKEQEGYCDCHERCPKCGKKYKPNSNWGTLYKDYWNGLKRYE